MKKFSTTAILAIILLLFAITSINLVIAADEEQNKKEKETEVTPTPNSEKQSTRSSPNITFTPTEEISEDLPVSFPADI